MKRHMVLLLMGALITVGLSGCYTQLQPIRLNDGFDAYNNYGGYAPSSNDTSYVTGYQDGYNDASYYYRDYNVYNYWAGMGVYSFYSPYDYYSGYYTGYWSPSWNLGWRYNFYSDYYGFNPYYYPWSPYYGSGVYIAYNYYTYPNKTIVSRHRGIRASGIYRDGGSGEYRNTEVRRRVPYSSTSGSRSNSSGTSVRRTTRVRDSGTTRRTRSTYSGHNRSHSGTSSRSGGRSTRVRSSGRGGSSGSSHRGSGRGHGGHNNNMQSVWIPSSNRNQSNTARLDQRRREREIARQKENTHNFSNDYVRVRSHREQPRLSRRERALRSIMRDMGSVRHESNSSFISNSHRSRSSFNTNHSSRVRSSGISGRSFSRSSSSRSSRSSSHSGRSHRH